MSTRKKQKQRRVKGEWNRKVDPEEFQRLRAQGYGVCAIARYFGISKSTSHYLIHGRNDEHKWPREKLITDLQDFYEWYGRAPTQVELNRREYGLADQNFYRRAFGAFENACREAGIPANHVARPPRPKRPDDAWTRTLGSILD